MSSARESRLHDERGQIQGFSMTSRAFCEARASARSEALLAGATKMPKPRSKSKQGSRAMPSLHMAKNVRRRSTTWPRLSWRAKAAQSANSQSTSSVSGGARNQLRCAALCRLHRCLSECDTRLAFCTQKHFWYRLLFHLRSSQILRDRPLCKHSIRRLLCARRRQRVRVRKQQATT